MKDQHKINGLHHRFPFLRGAAALALGLIVCVAVATALLHPSDHLHREHGILEHGSLLCWILSALIALAAAVRSLGKEGRWLAAWTCWMAVLAALRELDMHVLLNPQHFGPLGVRYRLDWWTSGSVSVWLRLGWGLLFLVTFLFACYPPIRLRHALWQRLRGGDPILGLMALAVVFLFVGFVVDDILRFVKFVSLDLKQLIEETSETLGAMLYTASTVIQWRRAPAAASPVSAA